MRTAEANAVVAEVHNRKPVVLQPEEERAWLADDILVHKLLPILRPYPTRVDASVSGLHSGEPRRGGSAGPHQPRTLTKTGSKNRLSNRDSPSSGHHGSWDSFTEQRI
jgi:SOS response associated peptidase (SRAP)